MLLNLEKCHMERAYETDNLKMGMLVLNWNFSFDISFAFFQIWNHITDDETNLVYDH